MSVEFASDQSARRYAYARRMVRVLLALLFLSEAPVAIYLLFFPYHFARVFNLPVGPEPFFIREVGNFLIFATYLQYVGFRDPVRNLLAVRLTVVLRVLAGALEFVETVFILTTRDLFYYSLVFFCVTNFLFAALIGLGLRQMRRYGPGVSPPPPRTE